MFKNFITYQLASGFERESRLLELPRAVSHNLMASARDSLNHLARCLQTQDVKEKNRSLYLALTCLRDCRAILEKSGHFSNSPPAYRSRFELLHGRLEQMCWDAAAGEGGQLRMLG